MSLSKNEIKFLKSLQQKKFRDQEQQFIVEGIKMVAELLTAKNYSVKSIYLLDTCEIQVPENIPSTIVSSAELNRISSLKTPNKVLAVVNYNPINSLDLSEDNLILLLDDIKDPGNLGTIIRTADWFGITQIICSEESVDHYNPKVVQASMGSIFRMNILYHSLTDSILELKDADYKLFGASMSGKDAFRTPLPSKSALVMGSESHGISPALESNLECLTIPRIGKAESLNVSQATGILLSIYAQGIR